MRRLRIVLSVLVLSLAPLVGHTDAVAASARDRDLCLSLRGDKSPFDQRIKSCSVLIAEGQQDSSMMSTFTDAVDALLSRCHVYRYQRKFDLAEKDCGDAFVAHRALARRWGSSVNRMFYQLYAARGALLSATGQYQKALVDEDEAVNSLQYAEPVFSFIFSNRGLTHTALRNFDAALEDFEQAVTLDGRYMPALLNRGEEYLRRGMRAQALADFEQASKLPAGNYDFGAEMQARAKAHLQKLKGP